MPLNNSLRGRTTQDRILASIVGRLIAQIDELDESNCWLTDQPIPVSIPGGRLAVTVSLGPGRFPAEFFAGGGADTLAGAVQVKLPVRTLQSLKFLYSLFFSSSSTFDLRVNLSN